MEGNRHMSRSYPEPRHWRKSSYSGNGPTCVEVRDIADGLAMRDSQQPELGHLTFTSNEWKVFLTCLKA
ncbi:DUF397 domain-containing protein [Nocardiopsis sp. NPDC049922]|uniref:DUF397 domain-containing protein n=1 Tax=Nocardiopsis sp. NPDC049922 TaxID=3155157 RepID=UPI00341036E0